MLFKKKWWHEFIKPENISPEYLGYMLKTDYFTNSVSAKSVGVSYPAINASDLVSFKILVPPTREQQKIADFLDSKVSEIDKMIAETKSSIENYKEYKQSVITEAVTKGLNKNVQMKDSGIEWIGEIPVNWEIMPLKYKCILNEETLTENIQCLLEKRLYQLRDLL